MAIKLTAEDKRIARENAATTAALNATFGEYAADRLDPNSPNYLGPGYADLGKTDRDGNRVLSLVDPVAQGAWDTTTRNPTPQNPNAPTAQILADLEADVAPQRKPAPLVASRGLSSSALSAISPMHDVSLRDASPPSWISMGPPSQSTIDALKRLESAGQGDGDPYTAPGAEAPKVNREAIDDVLGDTQSIQSYILGLAGKAKDYSAAEAQLRAATAQATSAALGQARAGNRRDRAMLERQAISEGAFNEQQLSRDAALLRAQEEDQNRRFQAETAAKAAELGLNVAAAMTNISQIDITSANNWINNEFQQKGIDKQISADKMQNVLAFTRDMAMIQFNYDQLSVEDQNEADRLMMQKYGIDEQTSVALKQLKEAGKFDWSNLLANVVGGAASGTTSAIGRKYF